MSDVITALKDAPVMNLFVLVGAILVVLAGIGRAFFGPSAGEKMDLGGRILLGGCGVALLAAATVMFLGLRAAGVWLWSPRQSFWCWGCGGGGRSRPCYRPGPRRRGGRRRRRGEWIRGGRES